MIRNAIAFMGLAAPTRYTPAVTDARMTASEIRMRRAADAAVPACHRSKRG